MGGKPISLGNPHLLAWIAEQGCITHHWPVATGGSLTGSSSLTWALSVFLLPIFFHRLFTWSTKNWNALRCLFPEMEECVTDHCHRTLQASHEKDMEETQNTELQTFLSQQMKAKSPLQCVPHSTNKPKLCVCCYSYPAVKNTCTDENFIFAQNCVCFSFILSIFFPPNVLSIVITIATRSTLQSQQQAQHSSRGIWTMPLVTGCSFRYPARSICSEEEQNLLTTLRIALKCFGSSPIPAVKPGHELLCPAYCTASIQIR